MDSILLVMVVPISWIVDWGRGLAGTRESIAGPQGKKGNPQITFETHFHLTARPRTCTHKGKKIKTIYRLVSLPNLRWAKTHMGESPHGPRRRGARALGFDLVDPNKKVSLRPFCILIDAQSSVGNTYVLLEY